MLCYEVKLISWVIHIVDDCNLSQYQQEGKTEIMITFLFAIDEMCVSSVWKPIKTLTKTSKINTVIIFFPVSIHTKCLKQTEV